jgi:hypothetical protein
MTMAIPRHVRILTVAMLVALFSGCLWAPELDRLRKEIEVQLPGSHFKKEISVSLGPFALALIRTVVRIVPGTDEFKPLLQEVRSVKVALYEVKAPRPYGPLSMPRSLRRMLEEDWQLAARFTEASEVVWLIYRTKGDTVSHVFIVVMDDKNLVLVRAEGRLDRLMQRAVRPHLHPNPAKS